MRNRLSISQIFFMLLDLLLINVAFFLAIQFRFLRTQDFGYTDIYLQTMLPISIIYLVVFNLSRVYKMVFTQKMWDEIRYCFIANLIAPILVLVYTHFYTDRLPYSVYILTMFIATYLTVGMRLALGIIFSIFSNIRYDKHKIENQVKVMLVGAGAAARLVIDDLKYKSHYNVVAVLDDADHKQNRFINGVKVVGNLSDLERAARRYEIDEIIFCINKIDAEKKRDILKRCADTGLKIKTIPSIYDIVDESVTVTHFREIEIEDLLERNPADLNTESIAEYLSAKTVMVTGAGGSIGSELVRQILRFSPKKIVLVDFYENTTYELFCEIRERHLAVETVIEIGSIGNKKEITHIIKKHNPHVILHAAAHKHVPLMENNPIRAFRNNVVGTRNVAEAADENGVERFVMISSDKAVRPTNVMGATKRIAEMIIVALNQRSKTVFTSVRFGNVLGSHGSVIPLFERQIKEGGPVTVTHKDVTRFFMTIPEAAQLVLQAGAMAKGGEIFMLDMGTPVKIDSLARNMIKLCGFEPDTDIKIVYTGLRPGEKMFEELSFSEETVTKTEIDKIFCLKNGEQKTGGLDEALTKMEKIDTDENKMIEAIWKIVPKYDDTETREIISSFQNSQN
ncbi:MAG: nucleoside-diphosphate sugar epimerase/dehydratase [Eubacteriales bacterium]